MDVIIPKIHSNKERRNFWLNLASSISQSQKPNKPTLKKDDRMFDQLKLDIKRSFAQYTHLSAEVKEEKKEQLEGIIEEVLLNNPELYYYQGFHDICGVLLLTLNNPDECYQVASYIAINRLRDTFNSNFEIIHDLVSMILEIVKVTDPEVYSVLVNLSIPPFFCVSWLITWFSHDIPDLLIVQKLFDFFISNHPMAIIYACAALPILFRDQLLKVDRDAPEVHQWLKELPKMVQPSLLIFTTAKLMNQYQFHKLSFKGKDRISKSIYGRFTLKKKSFVVSERVKFLILSTIVLILSLITFYYLK